jgi:hypothetical protein
MIGDSHAVRIAAEVPQNVLGSAERPFAIDHPVLSVRLPNQLTEYLRLGQGLQRAMKAKLPIFIRLLESIVELASEDFLQDGSR